MRFAVDPWNPAYGTSLETEPTGSTAEVDLDVECPAAQWRPLDPPTDAVPPPVVRFVDGVHRIDAQLWVDEPDGTASAALCASYAAGVVCCCAAGAHLVDAQVRRGLFTTAEAGADIVTSAGTYVAVRGIPQPDQPPMRQLMLALQGSRAATELQVALASATPDEPAGDTAEGHCGPGLLVVDGRLPARSLPRAIGYIKTHHGDYLPAGLRGVVTELRPGQRTPVFRLGRPHGGSWERCSWYLRLPATPGAPWAGVVRVECTADLDPAAVVELAGLSQLTLVRFASAAYKDPRAPQNLYPIAGLERALRRRLGAPELLYRALRRAAA